MRVVIAEDNALLREGHRRAAARARRRRGRAGRGRRGLLRIIGGHKPDLAIVDVRLPPTFTDEGVRAAIEARAAHPALGILILSQYVEPVYTAELLAAGEGGVGYLLKERVGDVRGVHGRGRARRRRRHRARPRGGRRADARARPRRDALAALTPRECEVLGLMAEGRTNAAIARALVVTPGAVEKHIKNIFSKLDIPATDDDHRRVLAVLAFLRSS